MAQIVAEPEIALVSADDDTFVKLIYDDFDCLLGKLQLVY